VQPRHRGLLDRITDRDHAGQDIVVERRRLLRSMQARGGVALRIEIDDQYVFADRRQCGAQIDSRGGLADAALLIGEREHAGMTVS